MHTTKNSHIPAIRRWAWSIFYHTIEKKCGDIQKQTLVATLDTDIVISPYLFSIVIYHSKHRINLALPTLVPVLNSPVSLLFYHYI